MPTTHDIIEMLYFITSKHRCLINTGIFIKTLLEGTQAKMVTVISMSTDQVATESSKFPLIFKNYILQLENYHLLIVKKDQLYNLCR